MLVFWILFMAFFLAFLAPNEYGLVQSFLTGNVDGETLRGGVHILGPFKGFVRFPAAQVTLEFSRQSADRPPVATRTGADPNDPDSGGQPILISCALQLRLVPEKLRDVYLAFSNYEGARQRFILLAGNMVSNTAQEFTPQEFWNDRRKITDRMLQQINATLWAQGWVLATRFMIMKVEFASSFEGSITQIQIAEQQRVVNEYEQQVQQVVQAIEVLKAVNEATIANISAGADAVAKEICAGASRDAFHMKQSMKAMKYRQLQNTLNLSSEHMQEYFKIKSVQGQESSGGRVVVGMDSVGDLDMHRLT